MPAPVIYKSLTPSISIPTCSVFTHHLASDKSGNIGGFPASSPTFIDANTGTTLTRASLKSLALSFGYGVTKSGVISTKLSKGDVILIFSPNSLSWPVMLFGGSAAGLKCTLANSAYTARELEHQWKDSGAKVIFAHPGLVPVAVEMFKFIGFSEEEIKKRLIVAGTEFLTGAKDEGTTEYTQKLIQLASLTSQGALSSEVKYDSEKEAGETVYLCYSSGTTGKPKGVETTHKNIVSLVSIVASLFNLDKDDVMLGVLPFYHIYGAVKLLHFPLRQNTPVVIMPKFDPIAYFANIEKYQITTALVVPPMLLAMARHPAVEKYSLKSLRLLFSGAAPLGDALVGNVKRKLESVGCMADVTQGYGLTETSPTTHLLPPRYAYTKVGCIGLLLPNLEARLVLDDTSSPDGLNVEDAKPGEPGELWIRGPTVMKGYLNNIKSTVDSITPDGWFKTGDITTRDSEGFYKIVDRRKELIKYKGFQVPPAELESVLLNHPDIADVAVIGIDSREHETELPRAYVVHANPTSLKSESDKVAFGKEVQEWIKSRVAKHKFLRGGVIVIDVVPKSAAGKILRRELRELAKKEVAEGKAKL